MGDRTIRRVAAAFAVAGATMLPLAACAHAPTAQEQFDLDGDRMQYRTSRDVEQFVCDKDRMGYNDQHCREAQASTDAQRDKAKRDIAAYDQRHPQGGFPWWGWVLAVGGVGFVGWIVVSLGPLVTADMKKVEAAAPPVLDYPEDYPEDDDDDDDDFDDDFEDDFEDDEPDYPAAARGSGPQPDGSFLAELQRRLSEGH